MTSPEDPAPGGSLPEIRPWSVTEFSRHLTRHLEENPFFQDLWVQGEVSEVKYPGSGHCYFTLRDEAGSVGCVIWRTQLLRQRHRPAAGEQVVIRGRLVIYEARSQYQIVVAAVSPVGLGAKHEALEKLKARLAAEGLLAPGRRKPLPLFPRTVAVVTSDAGAVRHDICRVLAEQEYPMSVVLVPAQVQGVGAEESVVAALALADRHSGADLIILARGGGSVDDLWTFNSERIARAIAGCALPVISAVGHETDYTLADLISDERAATPTAAAERVAGLRAELIRRRDGAVRRAVVAVGQGIQLGRARFDGIRRRAVLAYPMAIVEARRQGLDDRLDRISREARGRLTDGRHRLDLALGRLGGVNPLSTMSRGYAAIARLPEEAPVTSVQDLRAGCEIRLRLQGGSADAWVTEVRDERTPAAPGKRRRTR